MDETSASMNGKKTNHYHPLETPLILFCKEHKIPFTHSYIKNSLGEIVENYACSRCIEKVEA